MSRFRITMWPGNVIEVPAIPVPSAVRLENGQKEPVDEGRVWDIEDRLNYKEFPRKRLEFPRERPDRADIFYICYQELFPDGPPPVLRTPPDELYLRELWEVDVSSAASIASFSERYGFLGDIRSHSYVPYRVLARRALPEALFIARVPSGYEGFATEVLTTDYKPVPGKLEDLEPKSCLFRTFTAVEEAALYIMIVRNLVRAWQYHQELLTFDEVVDAWEGSRAAHVRQSWYPQTPENLYEYLNPFLSAALRKFHPQTIVTKTEEESGAELTLPQREDAATLYEVLCLQLANHIAEEATYRTCRKCGRYFVHQRGRNEYGQHRTGDVLYCSNLCARAQAQKGYRERQKRARELARQGVATEEIAEELGTSTDAVSKWTAKTRRKRP